MHKLKIVLPVDLCSASIELDGKPMDDVVRIEMDVRANTLTTVKLTMLAHVEIDGELKESEIVHVERGGAVD